ncbi:hypothetical protein GGD81_003010 [Rhodobium orientis]|uniref:Uncharacterized protein n=1 Tax=Rhodobium orientis TaxID=34017 RepID=A0A327JX11_9HYPH|nr:hypothetical protein [Rhodobium orientis]MBK5950833.1 hypothetical protein [Rhodobium orientis]RAI29502.1 hypothetical protein CH339_02300 [Rhodobium orientis]
MNKSVVVLLLIVAMLANGVAHRFATAATVPSLAAAGGGQGAGSERTGALPEVRVAKTSADVATRAASRCRPYTAGPASPRGACMSDLSLPAGGSAALSRQIPARFAVAHSRMPPGRGSPHPFHPPRVSS